MDTKEITLSGAHIPEISKRAIASLKTKKLERLKIMTKVRNLYFVNRMSVQEIATAAEISPTNVRNYLTKIRRDYSDIARVDIDLAKDVHQFYWELQARYDERIKRLWKEYHETTNGKLRLSVLKEIREQERQHIDILQELGIVHKESSKIDLKAAVVPAELKERTEEDLRKELASVLGTSPGEVIDAEIVQALEEKPAEQGAVTPSVEVGEAEQGA